MKGPTAETFLRFFRKHEHLSDNEIIGKAMGEFNFTSSIATDLINIVRMNMPERKQK